MYHFWFEQDRREYLKLSFSYFTSLSPAQNVPIFLFWPDFTQTLLFLHWIVYHFCSFWQIGLSFCPGYADRKCSIHAEAVEQSPQKHLSACLSPALQRLGQIIIMGYENFTWNSAFSETSRGCVITLLALFISLDKACLMPLNVLVGIKKGGPNGNLLTPVLWCYRLAHIVAPWEQD